MRLKRNGVSAIPFVGTPLYEYDQGTWRLRQAEDIAKKFGG
jgi:hypothetical protein